MRYHNKQNKPTCLALQVTQPERDRGLGPFFVFEALLQFGFVDVFVCILHVCLSHSLLCKRGGWKLRNEKKERRSSSQETMEVLVLNGGFEKRPGHGGPGGPGNVSPGPGPLDEIKKRGEVHSLSATNGR